MEKNAVDIVEYLLNNGANPNMQNDSNGDTPLILASDKGYANIVTLLIAKDADVNIVNK